MSEDMTDAEHGAQVRERLSARDAAQSVTEREAANDEVADYAIRDLRRLLDRAERAERERDEALARVRTVETLAFRLSADGEGQYEGGDVADDIFRALDLPTVIERVLADQPEQD